MYMLSVTLNIFCHKYVRIPIYNTLYIIQTHIIICMGVIIIYSKKEVSRSKNRNLYQHKILLECSV